MEECHNDRFMDGAFYCTEVFPQRRNKLLGKSATHGSSAGFHMQYVLKRFVIKHDHHSQWAVKM